MKLNADTVIVGSGVAGLFSALNLPREQDIILITKSDLESSDSFLAQGGICVLRDESDYAILYQIIDDISGITDHDIYRFFPVLIMTGFHRVFKITVVVAFVS